MATGEIRFVGTEGSTKTAWEPMAMTLVGSVAALIQGSFGSKGDGGGTMRNT